MKLNELSNFTSFSTVYDFVAVVRVLWFEEPHKLFVFVYWEILNLNNDFHRWSCLGLFIDIGWNSIRDPVIDLCFTSNSSPEFVSGHLLFMLVIQLGQFVFAILSIIK